MIRKNMIEKIKATDVERRFSEVAGSAQLEAALAGRMSSNACYIVREGIRLTENGEYYQRAVETYSVVTLCRAVGGYAEDIDDIAQTMQKLVFKALSGYAVPFKDDADNDDVTDPLVLIEGRLAVLKPGLHAWEDRYQLSYTVKTNQQ